MRQSRRTHRRSARSTTALDLSSLVGDAPGLQEREGGNGSALPRNPARPGVLGPPGRAAIRFDSAWETWSTKSALYNPLIPRWNTAGTAAILRTISRFQVLLLKLAFGRKSYLLLTIHNEKMMAANISIVHAACEQPHRIKAIPATVAGAMAAAAWYYKTLKNRPSDLKQLLRDARQWASTDYAAALMKGDALSDAERSQIAKRFSDFTGLAEEYILKANLRVKLQQFMAELRRSVGLTVGRYDSRYSSPTYDLLAEYAQGDPSFEAVDGAFTMAINSYLRQDLKFSPKLFYETINGDIPPKWDWKHKGGKMDCSTWPRLSSLRNSPLTICSCRHNSAATSILSITIPVT
jgi:hypothetical protein